MSHGTESRQLAELRECRALPALSGSAARQLRAALLEALTIGDQLALARILGEAERTLPLAERVMACWAPCIIGLEERESAGAGMPGADSTLRSVREQIRAVLDRFPLPARTLWLVPVSPSDVTAAHLMALLLARRGVLARPWIWAFPPREGRFMVVGTISAGDAYRDHPHVLGHATLNGECRRGSVEDAALIESAAPSVAG